MEWQGLILNVGLSRTAILIWVIPNQHFQSTLLGVGGGGHKKEYALYARENDDNSGRPLKKRIIPPFMEEK